MLTVTTQAAVLLPSVVVTVIVAVPAAFAVTLPTLSTVATLVSLLLYITFWLVAESGRTVAMSNCVALGASERVVWFNDTPVAAKI